MDILLNTYSFFETFSCSKILFSLLLTTAIKLKQEGVKSMKSITLFRVNSSPERLSGISSYKFSLFSKYIEIVLFLSVMYLRKFSDSMLIV